MQVRQSDCKSFGHLLGDMFKGVVSYTLEKTKSGQIRDEFKMGVIYMGGV